ncbi:reticulon-4 receptor-like 2 [Protopterus annectens]|uniref:reticulon-4 receptor-like 2 n=1 Tax=Protopterus annectens TaxID=7888 RepID=UPI001CFAED38|nr:reticulon-4 receptor-like 2 [Protopterus annectens]XP_043940055.1 reticulon-4 receptor-like 2 [Protopterus annectens]XP_043940057.1 reticulon-4 receptor-like 2 [Protopterus annectens]
MSKGRNSTMKQESASVLLLLTALYAIYKVESCPSVCTCYSDPMTVSCQSQNFQQIPPGIPANSQRVFLQNNRILELRTGSFGIHTTVLWLYYNNISYIEPGTFWKLRNLEELDLGDNRNLRNLDPDTFRGLEKIQSLHIYRCGLSSLPPTIFRKLYTLQYLYLQENNLQYLQDDLFVDLVNLTHLFLHGNSIRVLSKNVFRGLFNLDRLLLHVNKIQVVNRWAFQDLSKVTILYLFNNSLSELSGETMDSLASLQFLRLNANPWICDCRARSLWEWFKRFRVSSSDLICVLPEEKKDQDLRYLTDKDFSACPLSNPSQDRTIGRNRASSNGRLGFNGTLNNLYGSAEGKGSSPKPDPSTFYKGLKSNNGLSPKYNMPTGEDDWPNYENEGELTSSSPNRKKKLPGRCFGSECETEDSSISQWFCHWFVWIPILATALLFH